jgi:hypothetical protein
MQSSDYPDNLLLGKVPQALRDVADWLTTQKAVGNDAVLTITNGDGTATKITINNVAHATAADKSTGDKNGVDITNYLRGDVSITPSQSQTVAASGTPATLFAVLLSKIKAMQGTTNFQDAVPATLSALSGYFDSSGNALTAVKGKSTPTAGDSSTLIATTAFVASALSSAGYISTPIDSYDVSDSSAWWIKLKGAPGIIIQGINGIHQGATTAFPVAFNTVLGVSSTCNIGSKIGGYTLTNTTIQMNDLNVGTGGKPSYTDIMVVGV